MKKIQNSTIIIVFFFVIFLINFYFLNNKVSINNRVLNIILLILNCVFCLFIVTLIHELSHQIVAIILGMNLSIFVSYPFIISKRRERWKININFGNKFKYLGFIIPNIALIKDKEDYSLNVMKVAITTIAGPISSLLFLILCSLIPVYSGNFASIIRIFIIISLLLVVSSLFYGDGPMFLLLLINKEYAIKSLLSMNNYSSNYFRNLYLYEYANNKCEEIDIKNENQNRSYQFEIQSYIIYNHILHGMVIHNETVKKNIEWLLCSEIELNKLKPEIILYIHTVIVYLAVIKKDYNSGKELYSKNFLQYEEILKNHYLTQRTRYFLGYIDSFDRIIDILENCFEYKISENKINIEKELLYRSNIRHINQ